MRYVRPRLKWFIERMIDKLTVKENLKKSDWRDDSVKVCFERLKNEVAELEEAIKQLDWLETTRGPRLRQVKEAVILECADVSNTSMMLADKVSQIEERYGQ